MKKTFLLAGLLSVTLFACKKDDGNKSIPVNEDFTTTESKALNDFVDVVAVPQYNTLAAKAAGLNTAISTLNTAPTQANLAAARTAWVDMRLIWEQCEGFLFGPVEDNEYDPNMDTWPTDYVQMDSLLNTTAALNQSTLDGITLSLRGFHPIEYILFGNHGDRQASAITARQREYMASLAADLKANCDALAQSWSAAGGRYGELVKTAGTGSTKYASRKELFLAMVDGLSGICEEVGTGKMEDPLVQQDPKTVESPYSGNSVADFKNNIIGLQNVYLCQFNGRSGRSLSNMVAAKNQALDNKIRTQIATAISSFDNITRTYEEAIFNQKQQVLQTQAALATLQATLEGDLRDYINTNIKD